MERAYFGVQPLNIPLDLVQFAKHLTAGFFRPLHRMALP